MELLTLDSNFQPVRLIENFDSLIWSERYSTYGDFELLSSDVASARLLLPRETYVSLRESTVPMVVEDHKIVKSINDAPKLSITGRSLETVLERRGAAHTLPTSYTPETPKEVWSISSAKESDAAYQAMRVVLGDVARFQGGTEVLSARTPAVSPNDAIPEIDLPLPLDYAPADAPDWSSTVNYAENQVVKHIVGGEARLWRAIESNLNQEPSMASIFWAHLGVYTPYRPYEVKSGDLYTVALELINTAHRGLRAVRPIDDSGRVKIEVYNGADLSETVAFDARFDQFDSSTYLFSQRGSTNVAYVYGSNGADKVYKNPPPAGSPEGPSGLERRVLMLDEAGDDKLATSELRRSRGLVELYKYNATALFDGEVSDQVASGYNKDYFLGDILTLVGEYEISRKVRVAEFIRTADASGERAYPAFEEVDE